MIVGVDIREWQPGNQTGIGRFLEEFLRVATQPRPTARVPLVGEAAREGRVGTANIRSPAGGCGRTKTARASTRPGRPCRRLSVRGTPWSWGAGRSGRTWGAS